MPGHKVSETEKSVRYFCDFSPLYFSCFFIYLKDPRHISQVNHLFRSAFKHQLISRVEVCDVHQQNVPGISNFGSWARSASVPLNKWTGHGRSAKEGENGFIFKLLMMGENSEHIFYIKQLKGKGSVTTAPKLNNDLSKVIIMTQIMTQLSENPDLIMTHFTQNNDPALIYACYLILNHQNDLNVMVKTKLYTDFQ